LTEVANKIIEGDLDTVLPIIKSKYEINDLSNIMGTLVEAIKLC
jgi:hypothetical protein